MKKLLSVVLISLTTITFAQQIENTFIPYYMSGDTVKEFEKVGAKAESKPIGMGYGGVNTYYTVFNNPNSSVRFKAASMPKIVMKVDAGTETFELVIVTKADVTKKKTDYRRFVTAGYSAGGTKNMSNYQTIPTLKLIKDNLYEITFPKLEAGEYAFMPIYKGQQAANIVTSTGSYRLFCFAVE